MTRRKSASELVDGAVRNLKTMRQHRDALDEGTRTETEVEVMALRRVLEQLGARDESAEDTPLPPMTRYNAYCCAAGQPLFAASYPSGELAFDSLPGWTHDEEPVPGLTTDPSTLPARYYDVFLHRENGQPKGVYVSFDYSPG